MQLTAQLLQRALHSLRIRGCQHIFIINSHTHTGTVLLSLSFTQTCAHTLTPTNTPRHTPTTHTHTPTQTVMAGKMTALLSHSARLWGYAKLMQDSHDVLVFAHTARLLKPSRLQTLVLPCGQLGNRLWQTLSHNLGRHFYGQFHDEPDKSFAPNISKLDGEAFWIDTQQQI